MAEAVSVVPRVLYLKERLGQTQDPQKIIKALKGLQDLDISLDILVETGVGKTVNSFRKHATAGKIAKSLVNHWKKLIPPENESDHKGKKQNTEKRNEFSLDKTKSSICKENKHSGKTKTSEPASEDCKSSSTSDKWKKEHSFTENKQRNKDTESYNGHESKIHSSNSSKNTSQSINPENTKSDCKETTSTASKKPSEKHHCPRASKKDLLPTKGSCKDLSKQRNSEDTRKLKQTLSVENKPKLPSDEDFEPPTMSFESYLNYDQVSNKRKRKTCTTSEQSKNIKGCEQKNCSLSPKTSISPVTKEREEKPHKSEDDQSESPTKKAKTASLQDLLNTPLPKFLPEISLSSPPYSTEFKAPVAEVPQQSSDTNQFTGRRLNSKMQVYSGSKTVYLSKMLTLYEQCIRILQNNIDSLHEVGGVPFEILEPVLTRCTPEQLFRIEECNPTFIEESDHLWKKHCQRDFKNEHLLEYESWREMYVRLFSQREEKLKTLTKNIISAQSEKPKGRQVKLAYIHSVAKPPRNVRRQQEIYGTAGPIVQLHPVEKGKTKNPESRDRNNTSPSPNATTSNVTNGSSSTYSSGVSQDIKKTVKKIAPMMRKSLRAFKNRVGPR
ncbi:Transcription elongation factor B polypeptide 3 [Platysternon megacephalum]|uniref:Elongin-A n=1 Tax=Platysternon megacephalum TaxID=55544 RepID=A0A4D9E9S9_9SAUR|nr:Transcription elongation factor B polypeptide 3 [Platysternon megacephalum]